MIISKKPPRYRSYILTIWEEHSESENSPPIWRFSLEEPQTGKRYGFADLESLVTALEQSMDNWDEWRL